ncbi:helix-turn-helix domain-containing protein, partial [Microbulbifer sp. TYP-18]|uniref:helix-turn-helix domain-containing protein n=1 Tax=Microbulbifer sp. TYP-18 TaxID=3230024 RepID=UPI0034C5CAC3
MNKIDARKIPASAQEEKRRTAIKLWKNGMRVIEVADTLDVSDKAVRNWIR